MNLELTASFKKSYQKRIAGRPVLVGKTLERIELFRQGRSHPLLKDHALSGSMRIYRSFSITGDIRIVYQQVSEDHFRLIDIGSHNQVY